MPKPVLDLPRGLCPSCGYDGELLDGGRVRPHRKHIIRKFGVYIGVVPNDEPCDGAGQPPEVAE